MAPKRKRGSVPPKPPGSTLVSGQGPVRPSPSAREEGDDSDENHMNVEGVLMAPNPERRQPDHDDDHNDAGSEPSVDRVIRELREMDKAFHADAMRQRRAVEDSYRFSAEQPPDLEARLLRAAEAPQSETADDEVAPVETRDKKKRAADLAPAKKTTAEKYAESKLPVNGNRAKLSEGTSKHSTRRSARKRADKLPIPWKGRLGYACLNTYLRTATPSVFCSRTCRLSSILEHRHPLKDPSLPEHATKNRPDMEQPADISRGQKYVEELGLANARDLVKMIRWNDKYGIKFMRLSSEMFPFASHPDYGYKLAPFASEVLAAAGKVAGELGHRLTTHPGQYTQLGSPRKEVVNSAIRDLDYHDEMLTLLRLPEQLDRDAVMIIHMGGVFGDKEATLDRFRENYARLSDSVKRRLVLENDDVSWSVHDILPVCEELNIPMVLDYHHHNIIHDPSTEDGSFHITDLDQRIRATWTRKNIRQKSHYSEPCEGAVTGREMRKHSARVKSLPPCPADMDLMIEAKDKEQAVFELMRKFKLPGWELLNEVVPHERDDEPKNEVRKKAKRGKKKASDDGEVEDIIVVAEKIVSSEDVSMGGPSNRVYWPEGKEEWLRPKKRERVKVALEEDECDST